MAQKRIKMTQHDPIANRIRLLYDDGTQGEIIYPSNSFSAVAADALIGLTLKQAKMKLGIKK